MKALRKWSRILHRDIGYFFIFTSLIYGISGIALNHMSDWNPNYSVDIKHFTTSLDLGKSAGVKSDILKLLDEVDDKHEDLLKEKNDLKSEIANWKVQLFYQNSNFIL